MAKKDRPAGRKIALNRKARRNYFIEETVEAGKVSCRDGHLARSEPRVCRR